MSIWKCLLLSFFAALLSGGSFIFWFNQFDSNPQLFAAQIAPLAIVEPPSPKPAPQKSEEEPEEEITLLFAGDIMLDRGVEAYIKKSGDWKWPFLPIAETLKEADILFGNLESQISDKGRTYAFAQLR